MKILITGASGFVGGALMEMASARGDLEVHGLGRRPLPLPNYSRRDLEAPLELDFAPDVVIHAAARALPWGSRADFHRQNVLATEHVIDFCKRKRVQHLVYISSSSVFYREEDQEGLTEESPIGPDFVNHYSRTKHEGERLVRDFPGRSVILRPRAVFGPGDTVLFPRLLAAARAGKMYRLERNAAAARGDLIYIGTLCDYILKAATDPGVEGDFNLTNGQPVEIESFLFGIFQRLGIPLPEKRLSCGRALKIASAIEWFYKLALPGREPPITRFGIGVLAYSKTFNVAKSLAVLGSPAVALEEGVEAFLAWQREQMHSP